MFLVFKTSLWFLNKSKIGVDEHVERPIFVPESASLASGCSNPLNWFNRWSHWGADVDAFWGFFFNIMITTLSSEVLSQGSILPQNLVGPTPDLICS